MKKIRSLSMKLSLSAMLMAVPVFIVSLGILFYQSRHFIRYEAVDRATSVLNTTMQRVNSYMNTVETATNSNEWIALKYLQPDTLMALSHRIVLFNRHADGSSITTEPGTFPEFGRYFSVYSFRQGDSVVTVRRGEYEYFDRIWYKNPRNLGKACWVDPFNKSNEGTPYSTKFIATYCKPLYQADGRFVGVISTDLSLRELAKAIESATPPYQHAYFMMTGSEGQFFVHPDTSRLFKQTIFTGATPRRQADIIALGHEMTAGKQGSMVAVIDDQPCLVCYQPVPGTHWSLALVCPDSDILYAYHRLAYIITALIIVGLLVILLLCRQTVAHAIRPISQLLVKTQTIAEGNYEIYIPHSPRKDAVGQLQNSFATMLESLNFQMGSIRYTTEQTTRRNEELATATRLAKEAASQKTAFIQNMTHQIRTPLNIIMGFAQVLRDNHQQLPESETRSIADMMTHNSYHLNRMVLMLFDSSDSGISEELKAHKHDLVSCNEIARESIGFTKLHFPGLPIRFTTEVPDDLSIHSSHLYLMRSIRELLYNAAKYSDGQHVTLHISQTATTVRFVFEDTGPGITDDYLHLMFTPFTKVNDLSEGLGLGLPLAKRHIQNLDGNLTFDPDYHEGCRFVIELPK
jgi:signal transduction histidine kinase